METKLSGNSMPVLQIGLQPGEKIVGETGQMAWMTPSIQLHTTTMTGGATGFFGALKRAVGGGGLFMTEFSALGGPGLVAFAAKVPGEIMKLDLQGGRGYMVHRHGFLCGTEGLTLGVGFQRSLGVGLFGGEGFVLQHVTGSGTAWVELGGEIISYDLPAGEQVLVHPGHVGLFEDSVSLDIRMVRGIRNALFGGEGLFLTELTGPGKIWLQTLTVPGLAHALERYMGKEASSSTSQTVTTAAAVGGIASLLGGWNNDST
jgi:uncharacterized protein (TIGR00266 family)